MHIDPTFSETFLKYTVAHEYNHTVAMENYFSRTNNLLNSVIIEGKADTFATLVYPDETVPWIEPLSETSEQIVLDSIRTYMDTVDYKKNYEGLHYGNYNNGIPEIANYRLGYTITQSFLKHNPEVTVNKWTRLAPEDIVKGSDNRDLLE